MSKIRILSEHLANQIAAGEVIERPASVVKELLENAIDAGAGQVQIEIEGNGTKLIKVIDDGTGMDGDDVLLCLERHATSKLGEGAAGNSRLSAIRSLGFRGEAIPSIASVSNMTITSRTERDTLGTRVEIRYGKITKVHEAGCNKGTVIEIRDLFGNVPARKKFLKSARTELQHIEEIVRNYSLAENRLGVTCLVNGKAVLDLDAGADSREERVRRIYDRNLAGSLISIEGNSHPAAGDDVHAIAVEGFLLPPEQAFAASARLRLFVNGRAVRDRMMVHAVSEGMAGYLMKGRTTAGAVFVTLPPETVDVNVHPAKHEIRFRQPELVHRTIADAVRAAMARYQEHSRDSIFGGPAMDRGEFRPAQTNVSRIDETRDPLPLWNRTKKTPQTDASDRQPYFSSTGSGKSTAAQIRSEVVATAEPELPFQHTVATGDHVPESLHPIGQFMDLYLLCEARQADESYLVVIDQHAVHERILFENFKQQFYAGQLASQNLLFPKMVELAPESGETIEQNREPIRKLGLIIEEFGGDHYIIKAVPSVISHLDPEEILTGILAGFSGSGYTSNGGGKRSDATRLDDILSTMACKAAIKAGQNLTLPEMQELLKLMKESRAFTHCPHGRPVVRMFSGAEIKKWFHRN